MRKEKDHNEIHQNTERWFKFNAYLSGFLLCCFYPRWIKHAVIQKAMRWDAEAIMIQVPTNMTQALQKGARHPGSMKLQCNDSFSANSIV